VAEDAGSKNKRIPGPDDDCPICYDGMHGVAEASLVFCEECGNALHKECFQQCGSFNSPLFGANPSFLCHICSSGQRTATSNGKELTCVWCRARWVVASASTGTGTVKRSMGAYGYLNLSGVADVSPVRDTSTCKRDNFSEFTLHSHISLDYHGPRRGERYYGWQDYQDT